MPSEAKPGPEPGARRNSEIKRVAADLEAKVAELREAVAQWQAMLLPPEPDHGPSTAGKVLT